MIVRTLRADVALALVVAVASAPVAVPTGVAGWIFLAAGNAMLIWRRRAPVAVAWGVFAVALAAWTVAGVDGIFPVFPVLVASYTVTRRCPMRQAAPPVAAVAITFLVTTAVGELSWRDFAALSLALAAAVLLGLTLARQQQLAAAAERERMTREMHDVVTHNLSVMVALADGAALTADPRQAAEAMRMVSDTGRQALSEMRHLLEGEPVTGDLAQVVSQVQAAGLNVTLVTEGAPGRLADDRQAAVYRIVQEALTNSLKHAGPGSTAEVRLGYTLSGVDIEITDNGAGQGLAGMRQRARAFGGEVEAGPLPDGGWRVQTRLEFDR